MGGGAMACEVAQGPRLDTPRSRSLTCHVTKRTKSRDGETKKRGTRTLGRERSALVVERIQHIVRLMVAREWKPEMAEALASEWKVSTSRVQQMSAEASRFVRFATGDTSDLRNRLVVEILECLDDAKARGKLGDRIFAVQVAARDLGIVVPKLEAEIRHGDLEKLSDEELLERLEAEAAKLRERVKGGSK